MWLFFLQCSPNADLFSMMFEKEIIKNRAEALLWLRGYNISSLFKADLITLDICRHTQTPITYSSIGNSTQACLILSVTSHGKIFCRARRPLRAGNFILMLHLYTTAVKMRQVASRMKMGCFYSVTEKKLANSCTHNSR